MGSMSPQMPGNDWLSRLAPDHAPPPPGWWPPATGWWLLAAAMLAAIVATITWWRHPTRRRRSAALGEIRRLESSIHDDAALAQQLEHVMRRYAVSRYGREAVAGLSGTRWIEFVVRHGGHDWDGAAGTDLLRLAYGGGAPAHRERWLRGARAFVKSRMRATA
jgi:hypothetical protein